MAYLRDPVQEGDDDESDDGEGGGGDHGELLSYDCFRNDRARSRLADAPPEFRGITARWTGSRRRAPQVLSFWSVSFPTRFGLPIGPKRRGSMTDPSPASRCGLPHLIDGFLDSERDHASP
jgi:hypothetical protein